MQGRLFQVNKEPLLAIPIYASAQADQEKIATWVRRIMRSLMLSAEAGTDSEKERLQRQASEDEDEVQEAVKTFYSLDEAEWNLIAAWDATKPISNQACARQFH